MSYVLKALRRADAERERGAVPDLRAQTGGGLNEAAPASQTMTPWVWGLAALALLLAAALGWRLWPAPAAPAALFAAPPSAPVAVAPPAPAPPPPVLIRIEAPPLAPAPVRPAAMSAPTADPAPPAVVRLQDLPEALRRQIPPLTFGGAMDSPVPASRMLIVNGQVMREGDLLAPGLRLERIALRSAILRLHDQAVEVAF